MSKAQVLGNIPNAFDAPVFSPSSTISAAGTTTITPPRNALSTVAYLTVGAGSGVYTHTVDLLETPVPFSGGQLELVVQMPASLNPTLAFTSGGAAISGLTSYSGTGTAHQFSVRLRWNAGTSNWELASGSLDVAPEVYNFLTATTAQAARAAIGAWGPTSIWIGAGEFIPRVTNGCGVNTVETGTNRVNYDTLDFDTATQEFAQVIRVLPNNWNAGTISVRFYWTAASGSGGVTWQAAALALTDGLSLDTARGSAQTTGDTFLSAGQLHITATTPLITLAGTPGTVTPVVIEVARVPADNNDTLAVDAQLLGIELNYTAQ